MFLLKKLKLVWRQKPTRTQTSVTFFRIGRIFWFWLVKVATNLIYFQLTPLFWNQSGREIWCKHNAQLQTKAFVHKGQKMAFLFPWTIKIPLDLGMILYLLWHICTKQTKKKIRYRRHPFLRDSTSCRPKGLPLCTILRYPYLVTDPINFLQAPA